ncbi:hypothetical protein DQG23_11675 [Paenibacillus contaminans]|uniref:Uncharacterized protein n=1 Tax=Paenibacillus contaminans TaxID=450362 RepID=A0A329MPB3_9BACL|nr:hypothetical protein DQG23_11675 [Paenibacillus contaminans]
MYEVEIYEDKLRNSELKDWLRDLKQRKDKGIKEARIVLNQIHYLYRAYQVRGHFPTGGNCEAHY